MKQILLTLFMLSMITSNSNAQNGWIQKQNGPAKNRAGSFVIGDYAYYGAGNNTNGTPETNTWYRYDLVNDSWTQIASMPQGMQALESFAINGKGYAGVGWYSGYSTALFYEYDPVSNGWTQKASYPTNTVHDAGNFVLNGEGYIFGGAVPYSNAVQVISNKYIPSNNTWNSVASLPIGMRQGVGFVLNNTARVLNGESPAGVPFNSGFTYNQQNNSWSTFNNQGGLTYRYNIATKDSLAFIIKAKYGNFGSNDYEFWNYNDNSQVWSQLPDRPFIGPASAFLNINNRLIAILPDGQVWEYNGVMSTSEYSVACDTALLQSTYNSGFGRCVQTSDGNIVAVGNINSLNNWTNGDIVLNKYDQQLNLLWSKVFYPGAGYDYAIGLIVTSDGGFLIQESFGNTNAPGVFSAGYIIKTDSLGNQQWVQTLVGQSYGDNYGAKAVENSNGEFICYGHVQHHSGCSSYATRICKLSASGSILWSYCLPINPDWTGGIDKLKSGNLYISLLNDAVSGNIQIRKWNDNGQQTGLNNYKFNGQFNCRGLVTSDKTNGFYIHGSYDTTGGKKNAFIAYFDDNMNFIWEKSISRNTNTNFSRLTQDNNGFIYCTGSILNPNAKTDLLVAKFDQVGNYIGAGRFGSSSQDDLGNGITVLNSGEIVCSGSSGNSGLLVKFCNIGCGTGQTQAFYSDLDGDGYGDSLLGYFCQAPNNSSILAGDCNDANPLIYPLANEICNGLDDDCNSVTDEGLFPVVGAIAGQNYQCIPLSFGVATYKISSVLGATNYNWIPPSGTSVLTGQGTDSITLYWNLPQAHDGIDGPLRLIVTGACGQTEVEIQLHIQISIPVRPSSVSGPNKLCPGEQATFSILPVARAHHYNWTLPSGMSMSLPSTSNIITVNIGSQYNGGVISVTAENACGVSSARTKTMLLNLPVLPGSINGLVNGLCNLSNINYSVPSSVGVTNYNWVIPVGASIQSGQGTSQIQLAFDSTFVSGQLSVAALNSCGTSSMRSVLLKASPPKPGIITGAQLICPGQNQVPYSIQTVSSADNYSWNLLSGLGFISTGQGTKNIWIDYAFVTTSGQQLSVIALNYCGVSATTTLSGISILPGNCNRNADLLNTTNLTLYPNPAAEYLQISGNENNLIHYRLYDMKGALLRSGSTASIIELNGMLPGLVVAEIYSQEGILMLRKQIALIK